MRKTPLSVSFPSGLVPTFFLLMLALFLSPLKAEAQWWKFWKKRDKTESVQSGKVESEAPIGRDLKDVEKERKAAEKVVEKERKKLLRDSKERQEELEKQRRESQKEIEKNQKKILSDNRKNQRKLMRDLKAKSANPSGKRASFLQRYRYKKSSGDSFFLSQ
jgi:hypothetical protein